MSVTKRTQLLPATHYLNKLEDTNMVLTKVRSVDYQELLSMLKNNAEVTPEEVLKLMKIVENCLKWDINNIPHALTVMSSLLTKKRYLKIVSNVPAESLLPSTLTLMNFLKTLSVSETHLKIMTMQVLLSYPLNVLIMIVTSNNSELMEIFEDLTPEILQGISDRLYIFLQELLINLPPQEKGLFIKDGLSKWFCIIDLVLETCTSLTDSDKANSYVGCVEVLTNALEEVDFYQCPKWEMIHENIIVSKSYPNAILKLLKDGSSLWHKYWISIIKLLKKQIRQSCIKIQPMLNVVENAFKMDSTTRCRAFKCWDELIDSANVSKPNPKFFKLLTIPLTLYNAKTLESVEAKFQTWWNLMKKFESQLHKLSDDILVEFIHFMFGRKALEKKNVPLDIVAGIGQTYPSMLHLCLQAFAEISGHKMGCDCITDLTKLNVSLLNSKQLTSHWYNWKNALRTAITVTNKICNTDNEQSGKKSLEVLCIWKAYMMLIAEFPANGVRKDMFNDLVQVLVDLFQTYQTPDTKPDIIFSLIMTFTEDNESMRKLLAASVGDEQPLKNIITMIVNPRIDEAFKRYEISKMVETLKPLSDLAVDAINSHFCLDYLGHSNNSLIFWMALTQSVIESHRLICSKIMRQILIWPVLVLQQVQVEQYSSTVWQTFYYFYMKKFNNIEIDMEILKHIKCQENNSYFKTVVAACILKNQLLNSNKDVGGFSSMLENITAESVLNYKVCEQIVPLLIDTVSIMLEKVSSKSDVRFAKVTLNCVKNIVSMCCTELTSEECKASCSNIFIMLDTIFNGLQLISKTTTYSQLFCELLEFLKEFVILPNEEICIREFMISKFKCILLNSPTDVVASKINETLKKLEEKNVKGTESDNNKKSAKQFTSPNVSKVKKNKKSKPEVVGTVTENGEEYAVVNSNWHPQLSKLTENQKEKLQGPRKPLPSMYQDLSQSQDEFKKTMWKTDSQDVTTESSSISNSKSKSNSTSNILKDVSYIDIVPNIIQNLLPKNDKDKIENSSEKNNLNNEQPSPSTPKNNKSRMSIKDRVNRNFQNLIKKGTPHTEITEVIVHDSPLTKTPDKRKLPNVNASKSAPTLLSAHRPSRVKRVPKKLEDAKLFGLKRRRNSQTDSQSETETEMSDESQKDKNKQLKIDVTKATKTDTKISDITSLRLEPRVIVQNSIDLTTLLPTNTKDSLEETLTENKSDNLADHQKENSEKYVEAQNSQKDQISCETQDSPKVKTKITDDVDMVALVKDIDNENIRTETVKTPVRKSKPSQQKTTTRKSRIEKELAIDTVEGNPFLKVQSESRLTRTKIANENVGRRKSVPAKLNKSKTQKPKVSDKSKRSMKNSQEIITVEETQEENILPEDAPYSEDIIESSQDSTLTTISVQATKRTPKRQPLVSIEKLEKTDPKITDTQDLLQDSKCDIEGDKLSNNRELNDDIELPFNKTAENQNQNHTETMDTEPLADNVIVINDHSPTNETMDTEELAAADTQPNNTADFAEFEPNIMLSPPEIPLSPIDPPIQEVIEPTLTQPNETETDVCSPYKHDVQRKQDFLNDTSQISPIKVQSPDLDKGSPEKNEEDYVVVKLATPVQSNGEPYLAKGSPEFFPDDKTSPEKREQSPPRPEVAPSAGSPNSLSLKKNRTQTLRPSGRSALMVGLCVPDSLNKKNTEKTECEKPKKLNLSTPARRTIRMFNNMNENDSLDDKNPGFLTLNKVLPPADSSPVGPILKRKIDVMEDSISSPASKRKRVSFQDPPVSTRVAVERYINEGDFDPPSYKSSRANKSKTQENTINKLDKVMSKTIESFSEPIDSLTETLDVTPAVEVVVTSELNNTDPICMNLINCKDPIENIAEQLSSPTTKDLFIKDIIRTVSTIGDLAKMTELEVNRLCIKAPKIQVARKALTDHLSKIGQVIQEPEAMVVNETDFAEILNEEAKEPEDMAVEDKVQELSVCEAASQTVTQVTTCNSVQTDSTSTRDVDSQTLLSGFTTTSEIITTCISERADFVEKLGENLPMSSIMDILISKSDKSTAKVVLSKLLDHRHQNLSDDERSSHEFSDIQQFLLERYKYKDLLLFCSKLFQGIYDKAA